MQAPEALKKFKSNTGLWQFTTRSLIFFAVLFAVYLGIFLWFRHTEFFIQNLRLEQGFYVEWLTGLRKTDFLNAAVFAVIAFAIYKRETLAKLPSYNRPKTQTLLFAIAAMGSLFLHYLYKYALVHTGAEANTLTTILKYVLNIAFVFFLAAASYTWPFIKEFSKKNYQSMLTFTGIGVVYFFLIQLFQKIWYKLSYMVSIALKWLLGLHFDNVYFSPGNLTTGPRLGAGGFNVGISDACSGIDSLLLFISLYSILLALDYKRMHVKRMLWLLIPGIIGTVAYNILRIYMLMLVGIYIDPEFAVDVFHSNIGWMLFLVFFVIFWHFGSKWVYKQGHGEQKTENSASGNRNTKNSKENRQRDGKQKTGNSASEKSKGRGGQKKATQKKTSGKRKTAKSKSK